MIITMKFAAPDASLKAHLVNGRVDECLTRVKEIVSVISTYIVSEPRTTMQTASQATGGER